MDQGVWHGINEYRCDWKGLSCFFFVLMGLLVSCVLGKFRIRHRNAVLYTRVLDKPIIPIYYCAMQ